MGWYDFFGYIDMKGLLFDFRRPPITYYYTYILYTPIGPLQVCMYRLLRLIQFITRIIYMYQCWYVHRTHTLFISSNIAASKVFPCFSCTFTGFMEIIPFFQVFSKFSKFIKSIKFIARVLSDIATTNGIRNTSYPFSLTGTEYYISI